MVLIYSPQSMAYTKALTLCSVIWLLCTLYSSCVTASHVAPRTSATSGHLEDLLCSGQLNTTAEIVLNHTITYTFSPSKFCIVENLTSLVITSDTPSHTAKIKCVNNGNQTTSGIGFINIQNITLEYLHFENCGGVIPPSAVRGINDSYFYFGPRQSVVLLFSLSYDLHLKSVTISNYTGYAVMCVNVYSQERDLQITNVLIRDSLYQAAASKRENCAGNHSLDYQHSGSGILFYFNDSMPYYANTNTTTTTNVVISGSIYVRNYNCLPIRDYQLPIQRAITNSSVKRLPFQGGGALTVIYQHTKHVVVTNISKSSFSVNGGNAYGSLAILYLGLPSKSFSFVSGCVFNAGFSLAHEYSGGDIVVYYNFSYAGEGREHLVIENTDFVEGNKDFAQTHAHMALVQLTQIHARSVASITNSSCRGTIQLTNATYGCIFAFALGSSGTLNMNLVDVSSNVSYGAIKFVNLDKARIIGRNHSVFEKGTTSLIDAYNTDVYLTGNITFRDNHALYGSGGGGILLTAGSYLYLEEPLNVVFENNSAVYGGAIYTIENNAPFCAIQFVTEGRVTCGKTNCSRALDINVTFINNAAEITGHSVFADPIYGCDLLVSSNLTVKPQHLPNLYQQIFQFSSKRKGEIKSLAHNVCVCDAPMQHPKQHKCNTSIAHFPTVHVFLGQTFSVWMQPVDKNGSPVSAIVSSSPTQMWEIPDEQQVLQLMENGCSEVKYTITHRGRNPDNGTIYIRPVRIQPTNEESTNTMKLSFTVKACPFGFTGNEICQCSSMLTQRHILCLTATGKVVIPENAWVGRVDDSSIGFSPYCSEGYCNLNAGAVNLSDATGVCVYQRTGVLCGHCPKHLSVTFGSTRCQSCSNLWLLTIFLYGLAGLFLVFSLYALGLTVANGSLNGLIFYANILSTNMFIFLGAESLWWLLNFMATMNLDLGFPVCFYRGMDGISKAYFQFVFPMYLWCIAGLIIFISKYSVTVSKLVSKSSVPVLATVIHISFSKLTRAAFEGLASSEVTVEDINGTVSTKVVWYFDGNIEYGVGKHLGLLLLSSLTLFCFAVPYTAVLIVSPFLLRFRFVNHFKPLIDAYTGPYKVNRRFWFGLRVALLLLTFTLYEIFKGRDMVLLLFIESLILAFLVLAQLLAQPYNKVLVHAFDMIFLVDCFLLLSYGTYLHASTKTADIYIAAGILVGIVFLVFVIVVLLHLWHMLAGCFCKDKYEKKRNSTVSMISSQTIRTLSQVNESTGNVVYINSGTENTFENYDKYREPLLEDLVDS